MVKSDRGRILYIVYWGALEPLGQSLVVPSILGLAEKGLDLTLITFEKPYDLRDQETMAALRERFTAAGVSWRPLPYHKTPKWPATAYDVCRAILTAAWERRVGRFDIVHARTFVAGPMGFLVARLLGARLVYHNEGFYPDEQVDAGVWTTGSIGYRFARAVETSLYRKADGVVVLSNSSVPHVQRRRARSTGIAVSPSAIDCGRFGPLNERSPWNGGDLLRLCYVGGVGGRYRTGDLMGFVATLAERFPVRLLVLSRSDSALIHRAAAAAGLSSDAYEVRSVLPHDVMPLLAGCHAGLHFLPRTLGTLGGSPTKIGEYWACGLPVVVSPGIGDLDDVVVKERVGVIVESTSRSARERAAEELIELLSDPELGTRCRAAAAKHYSLSGALESLNALYQGLTSQP